MDAVLDAAGSEDVGHHVGLAPTGKLSGVRAGEEVNA